MVIPILDCILDVGTRGFIEDFCYAFRSMYKY